MPVALLCSHCVTTSSVSMEITLLQGSKMRSLCAASATAIAEATVEAHADAVTSAVKACPCMNVDAASAFASASLFVELVADAAVTAEATVCVEGKAPLLCTCGLPTLSNQSMPYGPWMHVLQALDPCCVQEHGQWQLACMYRC